MSGLAHDERETGFLRVVFGWGMWLNRGMLLSHRTIGSVMLAGGIGVAGLILAWSPTAKEPPAEAEAVAGTKTGARPLTWAVPLTEKGLPNLHRVSDTLYRAAQPTADGFVRLKEMGIKTVVNLRSFHSDKSLLGETGLGYELITMKAWHAEEKEVVRFLKIVTDPERQPVLVHCQHGADRTGTMCAIYRIAVQGWTKEAAIEEMREGGYGFFEGWQNLVTFINNLNVETIRARAGLKE